MTLPSTWLEKLIQWVELIAWSAGAANVVADVTKFQPQPTSLQNRAGDDRSGKTTSIRLVRASGE